MIYVLNGVFCFCFVCFCLYWGESLISSSTTTSKAKSLKKPTHERMCILKETHYRVKSDIIDQPGDCPRTQWSVAGSHLHGKKQTANLIPICRASRWTVILRGNEELRSSIWCQSLWSRWNFFNEFENIPSKKPPIEARWEASVFNSRDEVYPRLGWHFSLLFYNLGTEFWILRVAR